MTKRTCRKCGETKGLEEFGKSSRCKFGRTHECVACKVERGAAYRKKNADRIRDQSAVYHKKNADRINAKSAIYHRKNADRINAKSAIYYKKNAGEIIARTAAYNKENAGKIRDRNKKSYTEAMAAPTPVMSRTCRKCGEIKALELFGRALGCVYGMGHLCSACRASGARNDRAAREAHIAVIERAHGKACVRCGAVKLLREFPMGRGNRRWVGHRQKICRKCHKERGADYHQNNKEKRAAWNASRRAKKRGAATGDRRAIIAFHRHVRNADRLKCHWCGRLTAKCNREVDHIKPLSKEGPEDVANLCASCVHCNRSKGAKLPQEFTGQYELELA